MNYVGDFSGLQSEKDTEVDFLLIFFFFFKGPVCKNKYANRTQMTGYLALSKV